LCIFEKHKNHQKVILIEVYRQYTYFIVEVVYLITIAFKKYDNIENDDI